MAKKIEVPVALIAHEVQGEYVRVAIHGEIHLYALDVFRTVLKGCERHKIVVLDFAHCTFLDSSGLSAILAFKRARGEAYEKIRIANLSVAVSQILALTGLIGLFSQDLTGLPETFPLPETQPAESTPETDLAAPHKKGRLWCSSSEHLDRAGIEKLLAPKATEIPWYEYYGQVEIYLRYGNLTEDAIQYLAECETLAKEHGVVAKFSYPREAPPPAKEARRSTGVQTYRPTAPAQPIVSGPMTRFDACRKGGETTAMRHGPQFYEEIGRKGGQKTKRLIELGKKALAEEEAKAKQRTENA